MLNLPEFNILLSEQNDHFYRFTVEKNEKPYMCTNCGTINSEYDRDVKEFRPHQVKERVVSDISIHGKAVRIIIRHRRYKCPYCDVTFYEWLDSVDRNDKVTKRLKEHIKKLALKKPFTNIADEYGISHTSVRRYFEEYVSLQEEDRFIIAPRVLGIDEAHLNKTMRGVFTDTENFKLLEITKDNTKKTVKETIQRMIDYKKNIEVATIDMYSGYKYALRELVPNAYIVIDKFHVIQYAQRALDAVRIKIKKDLNKADRKVITNDRWILLRNNEDLDYRDIMKRVEWFKAFPRLGTAYWLKEELRDVYRLSKDRQEALERINAWEAKIPDDFTEFKEIRKTFRNSKEEILNYFDRPYTNAYTESVNNIIKSVEKEGKGYSFDVLRAKVLYGNDAIIKKPKYEEKMHFEVIHYSFENEGDFGEFYESLKGQFFNYGVDLTTLNEILERGEF
jgi:transposase